VWHATSQLQKKKRGETSTSCETHSWNIVNLHHLINTSRRRGKLEKEATVFFHGRTVRKKLVPLFFVVLQFINIIGALFLSWGVHYYLLVALVLIHQLCEKLLLRFSALARCESRYRMVFWTLLLCITGLPLTFSLAFQRPLRRPLRTFTQYSSNLQDSTAAIPTDLILSSGYCAFARHCGVLAAIEDFNISIDRCVGTSSGSIAASLLCSGQFTPSQIENELRSRRPISLCQPSLRLNRGAFSLRGLIAHLRTLLPKDFNQLPRKLAVGQL